MRPSFNDLRLTGPFLVENCKSLYWASPSGLILNSSETFSKIKCLGFNFSGEVRSA